MRRRQEGGCIAIRAVIKPLPVCSSAKKVASGSKQRRGLHGSLVGWAGEWAAAENHGPSCAAATPQPDSRAASVPHAAAGEPCLTSTPLPRLAAGGRDFQEGPDQGRRSGQGVHLPLLLAEPCHYCCCLLIAAVPPLLHALPGPSSPAMEPTHCWLPQDVLPTATHGCVF